MATIKLDIDEVQDGCLPRVCIVCGAPAVQHKRQMFIWFPIWARFLGFLGYMFLWKARVWAPLCARHRYHWTWRWGTILAGFVLVVAVGGIGAAILDIKLGSAQAKPYVQLLLLICLLAGFCLFCLFWIFRWTGIYTVGIDYDHIALRGVADAFVAAVERQRARYAQPVVRPVPAAGIADALPVDEDEVVAEALPTHEADGLRSRPAASRTARPRPPSRAWLWILLLGGLTLVACGGGAGLLYWFVAIRGDAVVLSRAQVHDAGLLKTVSVQYRIRKPDRSPDVRYIWVVQSAGRTVFELPYTFVQLGESGMLQGSVPAGGGLVNSSAYETWIELESPLAGAGRSSRVRISNVLAFR